MTALRATLLAAMLCVGGLSVAPQPALAADVPEEFVKLYTSDDAAQRAKAVDLLRKAPDDVKFEVVSSRIIGKEARADIVARAVSVLQRVEDPDVIGKIVKATKKGKPEQRMLYVEALSRHGANEEAHAAAIALVKDKSPYVRGMAAYVLGEHRHGDAVEPLFALLDDEAWQVQAAALESLPRLSDKEGVRAKAPLLVEFMENVSGRMRDDAADALLRITGKKLGTDPDAWRKFLETGEVPKPPEAEGGAPTGGGYGNQAKKPHFYGIEVTSEKVVIVLDVSLSMNDELDIDLDRLRRETSRRKAVTGGDGPPPDAKPEDQGYDIPWWRIKSRLDLARYQTINLIAQLQPEQKFELILFSTKVKPWMGRMVPATSNNKQKAIQVLENLVPEDKTNTWGAIVSAFDLMDNERKSYGAGPDTMYLVTDGAPSVGDIVDPDEIYEATMQLWKVAQIRIHCIGIGVNLKFMRKLCRKTGGQAKFFD